MTRILALMGASTVALGVMIMTAEARKVSYEINGQLYSYETTDPKEVAIARKRIEAANAADAAKAKAEAELKRNPLAGILGTQTQREAAQAQERLREVLEEQAQAEAALKRERASKAARSDENDGSADTRRQEQADRQPGEPFRVQQAQAGEQDSITLPQMPPSQPQPAPEARPAEPVASQSAPTPMMKSVSFDLASGIKTVIMTDGSVHEEPFDSNALAKLNSEHDSTGSLAAFVNRLRKVSPETTGSTTPLRRNPN